MPAAVHFFRLDRGGFDSRLFLVLREQIGPFIFGYPFLAFWLFACHFHGIGDFDLFLNPMILDPANIENSFDKYSREMLMKHLGALFLSLFIFPFVIYKRHSAGNQSGQPAADSQEFFLLFSLFRNFFP